ncbi:hypothetical protein POM88_033857 [Heracleum sosnowskyi]|uniref:Uncharacterized protein n=1 Tax=Heracleum sosnowskyi TaxID=360622 RepID=A0AAD8HKK2_9APIA|nr:hypothetical protein POM88_033857 [Heracleum sosnowskyi]
MASNWKITVLLSDRRLALLTILCPSTLILSSLGNLVATDCEHQSRDQQLVDKDLEDANEELDFRALENGYVAITLISLSPSTDADIQAAVSSWIASAIQEPQ